MWSRTHVSVVHSEWVECIARSHSGRRDAPVMDWASGGRRFVSATSIVSGRLVDTEKEKREDDEGFLVRLAAFVSCIRWVTRFLLFRLSILVNLR